MKNFLFTTLGVVIVASLIFLLGYLVGRGYDLKEEPVIRKVEKKEVVSPPRVTPEIPSLKKDLPYTVQVASSQSEEKALALVNRLKAKDYPAYIEEVELKEKKWYRVRVGSFPHKEDALKLVTRLKEEGLKDAMVWKREKGK